MGGPYYNHYGGLGSIIGSTCLWKLQCADLEGPTSGKYVHREC